MIKTIKPYGIDQFAALQEGTENLSSSQQEVLDLLRNCHIPVCTDTITGNKLQAVRANGIKSFRTMNLAMEPNTLNSSELLPNEEQITRRTRYIGPDGRPVILGRPVDPTRVRDRDREAMMRHPAVKIAMAARMAPVAAAFDQYSITASSPTVRALVRSVMDRVLDCVVDTGLQSMAYGFAPHEMVWGVENIPLKVVENVETEEVVKQEVDDPEELGKKRTEEVRRKVVAQELKSIELNRAVNLKYVKDLHPSHTDILVEGKLQKFAGLRYMQDNNMVLPPSSCYVVTHEGRFGQMYGSSALDSAYKTWYTSEVISLFCNRYFERKGDPPALGFAPAVAGIDEAGNVVDGVQLLISANAGLRSSGFMVLPHITDAKGNREFDYRLLEDDQRAEMFTRYLEWLDRQILISLLVPSESVMQSTRVGSFAASKTFADLSVTLREQDLRVQEGYINDHLIWKLVNMNFNGESATIRAMLRPSLMSDTLTKLYLALLNNERNTGKTVYSDMLDAEQMLKQMRVPVRDVTR